jgi:polyhydroxyalkanoate synthesis regulator phasin
MAEPADPSESGSVREAVERFLLAGVGAAALTKDRVEELADDLSRRGQLTREEARDAIDDALHRWRGDALRVTERAGASVTTLIRELGLVTRREWEELELRLAQVEHRLRLVEGSRTPRGPRAVPEPADEPGPRDVTPGPGP